MEIAEKTKKLLEVKDQIISIIERRGPVLPVHVAKETKLSILFASAFLSELVSENRIKISNMKVGGSPLYFVGGQESMLENFYQYLNSKEKEAFILLKNNKLLEDERLEPAIRVALRGLKDFAFTFTLRDNENEKLLWRYLMVPEEEAKNMIKSMIPHIKPILEKIKKKVASQVIEKNKQEKVKEDVEKIEPIIEVKKESPLRNPLHRVSLDIENRHREIGKKKVESDFTQFVVNHLNENNIKILNEINVKKKEYEGIIEMDSIVGKINFIVIAKDKKSVNESDIALAAQKSQLEKMPVLILSKGTLNKKAADYMKNWNGLIKFKQI